MPDPVLDLRAASPADEDARLLTAEVQRWYVELYGGEDDEPVEAEAFAPPLGRFLLGYRRGEPVAMGGWTRLAGGDVKLRRMYVRPQVRRQGFAAALLDALEDSARTVGAGRCLLTTGTPQAAAVAFYRARGYVDAPASGFYAAYSSAVHLVKAL